MEGPSQAIPSSRELIDKNDNPDEQMPPTIMPLRRPFLESTIIPLEHKIEVVSAESSEDVRSKLTPTLSPAIGSKIISPIRRQRASAVKSRSPRRKDTFADLLDDRTTTDLYKKFNKVTYTLLQVDQIWGLVVFLCILYNYLLFFFYLGIPGAPTGISLACEIFAELILLLDTCAVTYLYFRQYNILKSFVINHLASWSNNEKVSLVILWIASYPQHTINLISFIPHSTLCSLPIALLRALKLLRYPEVWSYFDTQLRCVKGFYASYVKFVQYVLNICLLIHAMIMLCLTVVRLEENRDWLEKYGFTTASSLEIYTEFLLLITSNMAGMCYGDAQPVTVPEMLIYCLVVFVGSTTFASLFGNLANSVYISNRRNLENRRKLEQAKHFATIRDLPHSFKRQLRVYYSTMYPEFSKYRIFYWLRLMFEC